MSNIDFEKFSKYSKPGPRYTSYPTALEFDDDFSYDEYIKFLEEEQERKYLYMFTCPFVEVLVISVVVMLYLLQKRRNLADI